jgi:hypothetical protein
MKSLTFKIEHGDWNAEIQLPDNITLDYLAHVIIDAVGFDMDHCFGFYDNLKEPYQSNQEYTLFADIGEEANANDPGVENTLVESVFKPKKTMLFLFDYGDDWKFLVTCTGELEAKPFKRPKLLATSGTIPGLRGIVAATTR